MVYLTSPSSSGCSGLSIPYCLCLYVFFAAMMTSNMLVAGNTEEAVIRAQGSVHIHPDDNNLAVGSVSYGVDVSWPMHHETTTRHAPNPLGADERQYAYKEYLQGCVGDETQSTNYLTECRQWESDRIGMNLRQPSISQNYTHAGFAKVETPPVVQQLLQNVWEEHFESQVVELWEHGNTYLNHWQSPTHMVDVSRILSEAEQWELVKVVQKVLEAWTQQPLILTSTYGIRVYGDGAILAPHVDRLPLVTSAIINVAQDVDEPWVLEVVGHDGKATNITMEPGDMVLYESHSVIHGRPFPLKGKYYANLFVHFEPVGHSFRHMQSHPQTSPKEAYERALARQQERRAAKESEPFTLEFTYGEEEFVDDAPTASLPAYVPPEKETRWRQQFEYEREPQVSTISAAMGTVNILVLAFLPYFSPPVSLPFLLFCIVFLGGSQTHSSHIGPYQCSFCGS